jgi:hypothetical protein
VQRTLRLVMPSRVVGAVVVGVVVVVTMMATAHNAPLNLFAIKPQREQSP